MSSALQAAMPSPKRATNLVYRSLIVYKRTWMVIFSGFFEPLFYLFALGFGLGRVIDEVPFGGRSISYAAFVAPGMLAASCLNGAITDGFFNPFFKLRFQGTYEGILATPMTMSDIGLGEIMWAQIRGSIYSVAFLTVMAGFGLVLSPWGALALPAAMLVAAAFSAGAMIMTGYTKRIEGFGKVFNLIVMPMFLFSGTFYPVSQYPAAVQPFVKATPLYQGSTLLRSLTTGTISWGLLQHVLYLLVMFVVCATFAMRRLHSEVVR